MEKVDALERKSQKYLRSAAVLLELADFDSCASRAYFAMFFAAQALLVMETQSLSSKQGIRSAFNERYVETGRLPARAGEIFHEASELQEFGDYAYDSAVTQEEAERILSEAEAFVNTIENMIERARVES